MNSFFKNFWGHISILQAVAIVLILLYYNSCRKCPVCPEVIIRHSVRVDTFVVHDTINVNSIRLIKSAPVYRVPENNSCSGEFTYFIPIEDSVVKGSAIATVSENKIKKFNTSFTYLIPTKIDSVIQTIFVPIHKNVFTIGAFTSQYSSGLQVGYRAKRFHACLGYDIVNRTPVLALNFDVK